MNKFGFYLLGLDHERPTDRHTDRHTDRNFRLTDVHGEVVQGIMVSRRKRQSPVGPTDRSIDWTFLLNLNLAKGSR